MSTDTKLNPDRPLTGHDRCDRCGSQAYLRVTFKSGYELLFCGHHAGEHASKINVMVVRDGAHVYDTLFKLHNSEANRK